LAGLRRNLGDEDGAGVYKTNPSAPFVLHNESTWGEQNPGGGGTVLKNQPTPVRIDCRPFTKRSRPTRRLTKRNSRCSVTSGRRTVHKTNPSAETTSEGGRIRFTKRTRFGSETLGGHFTKRIRTVRLTKRNSLGSGIPSAGSLTKRTSLSRTASPRRSPEVTHLCSDRLTHLEVPGRCPQNDGR
jgi:hypothetical protein